MLGALGLVIIALAWPPPSWLLHPQAHSVVQVLDRHQALLYEVRPDDFGSQKEIPLSEMPQSLLHAVISIEDRDFYTHGGISLRAITRALWQNVSAGDVISGGSTITQQLVRNRLQPKKRTILYKIREAFLAVKLEEFVNKDTILSGYLNTGYFGHQAYGISAAAHTYFGVNPRELSVAQAAMLAGLLQSPSSLDPFEHPTAAKDRQRRVLQAMLDTHTLSQSSYDDALHEAITLKRDTVAIHAPHFVFWLMDRYPEMFDAQAKIQTTLDLTLQTDTERIVTQNLALLQKKNVTSAAVVVLDAHTGDVLSMVGSADYFDVDHDGAVNSAIASRQPGSALKPFTYALAMKDGDTATTTVADVETQFFTQDGSPYTPRNYDFGFHGLVRYREALANSYNVAAVKVLQKVGVASLMGFLEQAGITTLTDTPAHYGLALTLGDAEVPLLELTRAYGIFARNGVTLTERALVADPVQRGTQILDPNIAWLITSILSDSTARLPEFGDASSLTFPFPVAAKTGTTRNSRDNWTIGYTPDIIVGVWVGNADNSPMQGTSGITGAGPIFHDVMLRATADLPPHDFLMPADIHTETICRLSGMLPGTLCPQTMDEYFIKGTEPTKVDTIFQEVLIDSRNGHLATPTCDPAFMLQKVFAVFPPDTKQWARENGWPEPPVTVSPLCSGNAPQETDHWLHITSPHDGDMYQLDPLIPDSKEQVILSAEAGNSVTTVDWFVNGSKIASTHGPDFHATWKPVVGHAHIEARSQSLTESLDIDVTNAQ